MLAQKMRNVQERQAQEGANLEHRRLARKIAEAMVEEPQVAMIEPTGDHKRQPQHELVALKLRIGETLRCRHPPLQAPTTIAVEKMPFEAGLQTHELQRDIRLV